MNSQTKRLLGFLCFFIILFLSIFMEWQIPLWFSLICAAILAGRIEREAMN